MADLTLLDQSVPQLLSDAEALPVADLMVLLAAENAGKTRKSAVAGLEALIAAHSPVAAPVAAPACPHGGIETVENVTRATTVHLGDGRRLAPGESAVVAPDVAAILLASELCR